eukprot:CAMPEP_0201871012 /NCGR_PEP_ID=MMETSP0902-20130614/4013_1 /ASSEMBLY_ACC=CAM_ASM_000551 /TAXON_ID=420261 /ORGANISM="Thalassiosira antarctica, Strain CCMP982" /LENGTH=144 /DNA_ID=CAMNT_0048396847 /DNA_START=153 /DNA_END=587 /DNA_ORIENTATION=+
MLQFEAPVTKLSCVSVPQFASSRSLSLGTDVDKKSFEDIFDSLSPPRKKLLSVLNEYKNGNFEHDTPTRFFTNIVKAVDSNQDGVITMEQFQILLKNIGAQGKLTEQDSHEIFEELGVDNGGEKVITVESIETRWAPLLHVMWK